MYEYIHYIFDINPNSGININNLHIALKYLNILCICCDNETIKLTFKTSLNANQESDLLFILKNYII